MLTVVCLKVGDKYDARYVHILQSMVSRHLSLPHRFLCLTDRPEELACNTVRVDESLGLTGWWYKLTLFQACPYGLTGTVLFLDLDVAVVDLLDPLIEYPGEFVIIRDFMDPEDSYNSSVFRLDVGTQTRVWDRFSPQVMRQCWGDQNWITATAARARTWPLEWCVSYRLSARERIPSGARVVCFHGQPKPHQCSGWVLNHWR